MDNELTSVMNQQRDLSNTFNRDISATINQQPDAKSIQSTMEGI